MDEKPANKKMPREVIFLMKLILIVVIILFVILVYLDLNYGRNIERDILVTFPPVFIFSIFVAYYLWKKGLMNSKTKQGFDVLFDKKRYF